LYFKFGILNFELMLYFNHHIQINHTNHSSYYFFTFFAASFCLYANQIKYNMGFRSMDSEINSD